MAEPEPPPSAAEHDRWVRLEGHASAIMGILNALIEDEAARLGRVSSELAAIYDAFEPVWRMVRVRLFPD